MRLFKRLTLALVVLAASMGWSQSSALHDRGLGVNPFTPGAGATPSPIFLPFGQVRICGPVAVLGAQIPCTPVASVFDQFNNPLPLVPPNFGQVTMDVTGQWTVKCNPGTYWIQIVASGSNTPTMNYLESCPATSTISNNVGPGIISFENVQTVDSTLSRGGADIIAEIGLAAGNLPASGGEIDVAVPTGGACYQASNTVTFTKPILIRGLGSPHAACIVDTTTSGPLFTFNCNGSVTSGNCGMVNLWLLGQCSTNACSGVTSTAINITGAVGWFGQNLMVGKQNGDPSVGGCSGVCGFATGISVTNASQLSFGGNCFNCSVFGSATGLSIVLQEEWNWWGGFLSQDGVPWAVSGGTGGLTLSGIHADDNVGPATQAGSTIVNLIAYHAENSAVSGPPYVTQTGGILNIIGGTMLEDRGSATDTDFIAAGGAQLYVGGLNVFVNTGSTLTQVALLSNSVNAELHFNNTAPTIITADYNTAYAGGRVFDCPVGAASGHNNCILSGYNFLSGAVLGGTLGSFPSPWATLYIGSAANQSMAIVGTPTTTRTGTLPDQTGVFMLSGNGDGTHSVPVQTKRAAGCATAASVGGLCATPTTVTWTTPFADTNYTVTCAGVGTTSGVPVIESVTTQSAGSVVVQTAALTAVAAQFTAIHCVAVHD